MTTYGSSRDGRLFLAILPDVETAALIHQKAELIRRAHGFQACLTPRDRLHVTLCGLVESDVEKVCETVGRMRAEPFQVSFDRTMSFRGRPGSRPFVLAGDDGLRQLKWFRRSLAAAMINRGLTHFGRTEFTPHVTLLFADRAVEENPVWPIGWTVRDFVLIHSMKGHRHLARWPLRV